MSTNISFGTKIILQDRTKHIHDVRDKIQNPKEREKTKISMCDFWTEVYEVPRIRKNSEKNKKYKIVNTASYTKK